MSSNHLYLVDGSGYIFRAYHRLPPLTNRHGVPAGAVYGFTTMLWKLVEELRKTDGPTHLAVVFDKSEKTFRTDFYPKYKAHRPDIPADLIPQFPLIRDAVRAFDIPSLEQAGFDMSGGLSFDVASNGGQQPGQGAPWRDDAGESWRVRAFQAALTVADETSDAVASGALSLQRRASGIDIRI